MPGLKIVVGRPDASLPPAPAPETLAPEIHRHRESVFSAPGIDVSFDVPEGYPSFRFANDEFFLFVEGLVYNRSDEALVRLGTALAGRAATGQAIDAPVREFLREADGEFVCLVVLERGARVILFNDALGRLPLYAAEPPSRFLVGREPQELLAELPRIRLDRGALAEWLAYEYTLNPGWFVEGIEKVEPGTLFDVTFGDHGVRVTRTNPAPLSLSAVEPIRHRTEAARRYVDRYLEGYADRARKLTGLGFRLTADLSGGFDTRSVFAGARRLGLPVEFYTDALMTGDESESAFRLAAAGDWSATRVAPGDFVRDAREWRHWVYLTGGRVNCRTMMQAVLVTRARRGLVSGQAARFMGFGGELVRRPYGRAYGYGSFVDALADDVYTRYVSLADGCRLLAMDDRDLRRRLAGAVAGWPETTDEDRARRLYFVYYHGLVNGGEDRHRWHFWTVSPLWAHPLLEFAYRSLDARMTGLPLFIEILRQTYPQALNAPLHRGAMDPTSPSSVAWYAAKTRFWARLRRDRNYRKVRRALAPRERWIELPSGEELAWLRDQFASAFRESDAVRSVFDRAAVLDFTRPEQATHRLYQVLTAVWFVAELGRRFPALDSRP